jgi:hypothetical protein
VIKETNRRVKIDRGAVAITSAGRSSTKSEASRVEVSAGSIILQLDLSVLDAADYKHETQQDAVDALRACLATGSVLDRVRDDLVLSIPIRAKFHSGQHHAPGYGEVKSFPKPDATLVRAIVRLRSPAPLPPRT